MAAAAVGGRLLTGFLIDRLFAARVGIVMMTLAAIGTYLLSDTSAFAYALIGALLVGFGTGGESDIIPYLLSRYFGLRSFSTLYGIAWMAGGVGGALGPILMGRAFDRAGSYAAALNGLTVVALLAAALMALLPRDAARPLAQVAQEA
jgi:nitrate/nitrite transporter NarK